MTDKSPLMRSDYCSDPVMLTFVMHAAKYVYFIT